MSARNRSGAPGDRSTVLSLSRNAVTPDRGSAATLASAVWVVFWPAPPLPHAATPMQLIVVKHAVTTPEIPELTSTSTEWFTSSRHGVAGACGSCNQGYVAFVAQATWILLSSRLPREPSRLRLAAWRRLKRLGAVLLHDAVWVLPADAKTREAFEWLADEIEEQGGTAFVWEAQSLAADQDRGIVQRFRTEADERYSTIASSAGAIRRAALRRSRRLRPAQITQALRQLRGLDRAFRQERRRDYFRAPGRDLTETAVQDAIRDLEARLSPLEGARDALGH